MRKKDYVGTATLGCPAGAASQVAAEG